MAYLIGDNTHPTSGHLHTILPAADTSNVQPVLYGIRAAGSRGDYDLLIIGSWKHTTKHIVMGIQCKTTKPAVSRMDSDLRRIYKHTGIAGVYAFRQKNKPCFHPPVESLFKELLEGCV